MAPLIQGLSGQRHVSLSEFGTTLVYIASSRPVGDAQWGPVSKTKMGAEGREDEKDDKEESGGGGGTWGKKGIIWGVRVWG